LALQFAAGALELVPVSPTDRFRQRRFGPAKSSNVRSILSTEPACILFADKTAHLSYLAPIPARGDYGVGGRAKRRGKPVVVDARDFFYSRINMAMGDDVVLEILDGDGTWQYVNDTCARVLEKPRDWFPGRNMFEEMPELAADWADILSTVAETRETYIDRTFRGVLNLPSKGDRWVWNVLAFPITLHTRETGVVLTARALERKSSM
jgi:hypothetical protein